MSASFLVSAVFAFAVAWGLDAVADWLRPGIAASATGGMGLGVAAVLFSQLAWQWRHWARLSGSTGNAMQLPTVTPVILGIGVMVLHSTTGVGYVAVGVVLTVAAVAYCAWRWVRMGTEPTAFPVGRLS
jgi:O-antigen/teichoic acid export membrane protein